MKEVLNYVKVVGFEPTYEELKRPINVAYINPFSRFEPTYEELKRN